MKRLLGLYREKQFSPGRHASNDVLILEQVAERLRARDCLVELVAPSEIGKRRHEHAFVVSMCQGKPALEKLLEWEKNGARIINRPQAALNTHRDRLPEILRAAGLAFPRTELITTRGPAEHAHDLDGGLWLKRGDVHAAVPADVQWIDSPARLQNGLEDFARRQIERAVLQEHRAGDEIKFYGVGADFFHWFYSKENRAHPPDPAELHAFAGQAAAAAGLDIFGGDVIVAPDGKLTLIDLNDWPSFAPCREPASRAIADLLIARLHAD
ncbi:MAG: hypothetical protein ACR2HH_08475 [Chthoniobacterales bacterium]